MSDASSCSSGSEPRQRSSISSSPAVTRVTVTVTALCHLIIVMLTAHRNRCMGENWTLTSQLRESDRCTAFHTGLFCANQGNDCHVISLYGQSLWRLPDPRSGRTAA
jgi:hypothetical protein